MSNEPHPNGNSKKKKKLIMLTWYFNDNKENYLWNTPIWNSDTFKEQRAVGKRVTKIVGNWKSTSSIMTINELSLRDKESGLISKLVTVGDGGKIHFAWWDVNRVLKVTINISKSGELIVHQILSHEWYKHRDKPIILLLLFVVVVIVVLSTRGHQDQ